jgi:hypothetical protein
MKQQKQSTHEYETTLNELKKLAQSLVSLNEQAYHVYLPLVDAIIQSKSKDENEIGHLLDRILDIACSEKGLLLYKKLCRYYWDINPNATALYINSYREMWDEESLDEEKK